MVDPVAAVAAWVAREGVPPDGERLLVGCSGGGDSTALLLALADLRRWPLAAIYVDHRLRDGTDGEAALVARLASQAGADFERLAVTVERRGNLLAQARVARYRALLAAAHRRGARYVAVGHTATDQAETVVFRAGRGDLAHALSGIPARRPLDGKVDLLRPLLDVSRAAAARLVAARGLIAVDDPTNARPTLTRTKIRRGLAPVDGVEDLLCDLARHTVAWTGALDRQAAALGALDALDAPAVAAAGSDVALRLLRRAGLHRAGSAHARALLALAAASDGTRRIDLGDGIVAERRYRSLAIGPVDRETGDPGDVAIGVSGPGRYRFLDGEVLIAPSPSGIDPALLDGAELRNQRPGDRFRTAAGHRKLSDLFIDRKLPRPLRRRVPILATAGRLLWVAGLGVARDASPPDGGPALTPLCSR